MHTRFSSGVIAGLASLPFVPNSLQATANKYLLPVENLVLESSACIPTLREVEQEATEESTHIRAVQKFAARDGLTLVLRMLDDRYVAYLERGATEVSPRVVTDLVMGISYLLPGTAICVDLNRDGQTDFVTEHSKHGNGLGALFYDRLLVLSSPAGYVFMTVPTMSPAADDFVRLGSDGSIVMLTRRFAQTEILPSGNGRSYTIHDLWTFEPGRTVLSNGLDSRFPKHVRMLFRENYEADATLTEEMRKQMSSEPVVRVLTPDV